MIQVKDLARLMRVWMYRIRATWGNNVPSHTYPTLATIFMTFPLFTLPQPAYT